MAVPKPKFKVGDLVQRIEVDQLVMKVGDKARVTEVLYTPTFYDNYYYVLDNCYYDLRTKDNPHQPFNNHAERYLKLVKEGE